MINCLFTGNSASYGAAVIIVDEVAILERCTFVNNSAVGGGGFGDDGGAAWLGAGVFDLANCTFSANTAADGGGGIYALDFAGVTLANCVFADNSADSHGGGMSATGDSPSTLTNWAGWYGGGMANVYSSQATLTNCTFSDNSADVLGGGIYNESDSDPTLTNCILWGNIAAPVTGGPVAGSSMGETRWSESDQIDGCSPVITYTCIEGCTTFCQDPQDHNIGDDPLFESDRVHIQRESPCVNAGCPYLDYTGQTDIDGQARELLGCVDMGADEVARTITEGLEVSGVPL